MCKLLYVTSNTHVYLSYTGTVSMVGRKRHSTHNTGNKPEVEIKRSRSKPEQQRKPNKTNNGTFRKDSKGMKTAGK